MQAKDQHGTTSAHTFSVSPCGQDTAMAEVVSTTGEEAVAGGQQPASRNGGGGLSGRAGRAPADCLPSGPLVGKLLRWQGQVRLCR